MKAFTQSVINIVRSIPPGSVLTYGQVATLAYHPRAARQVVYILRIYSEKESLPWQRVVGKGGRILLKAGMGKEIQEGLLGAEGIAVENGQIDMGKFQYPGPENEFPSTS